MVTHKINGVEIEEPVGFDSFKSVIKRTDAHGMSAEVSVGELEFYALAAETIKNAYNTDIDTELAYTVEVDSDEIYSGVIDLSTYEEKTGDYFSIKCKVGDIGVKTTFNNRLETKVDINRGTSLDDVQLNGYLNLKRDVLLPAKGIIYTSMSSQKDFNFITTFDGNNETRFEVIAVGFDNNELSEIEFSGLSSCISVLAGNTEDAAFFKNLSNKEGYNVKLKINSKIHVEILSNSDVASIRGRIVLMMKIKSVETPFSIYVGSFVELNKLETGVNFNNTFIYDGEHTLSYNLNDIDFITCVIELNSPGHSFGRLKVDVMQYDGNYFSLQSNTTASDSRTYVALVHETLSRVSEIISGLTVKSNWYGRFDSEVNPIQSGVGGGAMKALSLGYWLRNAVNTNGNPYDIYVSFKDLFQSLNAMDNIGWGFETENGQICVRVERWSFFYNHNLLLSISNVEKSRSLSDDSIFTRLSIGYDKYGEIDDDNTIDTFLTKRDYTTNIKSVDNELNCVSKFVSDPYAIEFTRRKALEKTTEDWTYDKNIFVFALCGKSNMLSGVLYPNFFRIHPSYVKYIQEGYVIKSSTGTLYTIVLINQLGYTLTNPTMPSGNGQVELFELVGHNTELNIEIDKGVIDSENTIISPETMYNARISPARNAIRWAERFFEANSPVKELKYTAGTVNVEAKMKAKTEEGKLYLEDSAESIVLSENGNIAKINPILKPEIIELTSPISHDIYNNIKNDPYGIIQVDGENCWIKEMQYNFKTSEAKFKLIPENV